MSATAAAPITERKSETANLDGPTVQAIRSQDSEASTHGQIAMLAYTLWEQRGCPYGSSKVDWLEAEQKLLGSSERVSP
jgi:Protein of unknown function (DUF2934)